MLSAYPLSQLGGLMPSDKTTERLDASTDVSIQISYLHHKVNAGDHFYINGFETVDSGDAIVFAVTTPAGTTYAHMLFEIQGTSRLELYIREGAAISGGSNVTAINSNRNSAKTSILTVKKNPTINEAGTVIHSESRGLEGTNKIAASAGISRIRDKIILKADTTYTFTVTSRDDGNIISYKGAWFEQVDRVA